MMRMPTMKRMAAGPDKTPETGACPGKLQKIVKNHSVLVSQMAKSLKE